jgi:trehalose-6-phosphatase
MNYYQNDSEFSWLDAMKMELHQTIKSKSLIYEFNFENAKPEEGSPWTLELPVTGKNLFSKKHELMKVEKIFHHEAEKEAFRLL